MPGVPPLTLIASVRVFRRTFKVCLQKLVREGRGGGKGREGGGSTTKHALRLVVTTDRIHIVVRRSCATGYYTMGKEQTGCWNM